MDIDPNLPDLPGDHGGPGRFEGERWPNLSAHLRGLDPDEEVGDVQFGAHHSLLRDVALAALPEDDPRQGMDWILTEDSHGFVSCEPYEHVAVGPEGYYSPAERAWGECLAGWGAFCEGD